MTFEAPENLPAVSREVSPLDLERDDRLLDLMADTVSYARDAYRVVEQVIAWHVRGNQGGGSKYVFINLPSDVWSTLEAFAQRPMPDLARLEPVRTPPAHAFDRRAEQ